MTEQIKPCPFCGSQPTILTEENTACWYVECDCEAQGPHESTSEQAITAWNTRAAMQADAAPVVARVSTTNPVVDHETGNTSDKLRSAVAVWWEADTAFGAACLGNGDRGDKAAAAVIEADRQATRAALVAEIVAWMRGNCMSGKWRVLASEIEEKWGKP